ncbi:MAG: guanylate kinase [Syntrophaceticus sp.]|jgi:guanylate kinase|nr:guanylate kinase [Syntrophaceticus sp.]MDD3314862.1 guanylate kinase [Syntrophaceticus sp.]MDD4360100.1 guanylate kinase [Syntrophaceticus sp.]MDD4783006.1 guanylate kinase [Syntrophaceticus sp.]HBG21947.1 guanylate kinase [Peptococcaceae bacterium]
MSKLSSSLLVVVSGPSGSGKGTLCQMLREGLPELSYSISLTTRPLRGNERNGVEYHFVSRAEFLRLIDAGEFLEWAEVYGNYYGTLRSTVEVSLQEGKNVLLEVDVQGGQSVKEVFPEAVLIFIMPPSLDELNKRISGRGTDTQEAIDLRLSCAPDELQAAKKYDYIIYNNVIEVAYADLLNIIEREKDIRTQHKGE